MLVKRLARKRGNEEAADHRGILFGSGLIAGEAVMAIIIAFLLVGLGKNEAGREQAADPDPGQSLRVGAGVRGGDRPDGMDGGRARPGQGPEPEVARTEAT